MISIGCRRVSFTHRHTCPERLAIRGGSNGGLWLVTLTQRPELCRCCVRGAALDMLRYHLFGSSRDLGPGYGNPDDPADFQVLRAYCPTTM